MRFRKLRIVWSVFWGLACVMLILLWVRSYLHYDNFSFCLDGKRAHWLGSISGELRYGRPLDFAGKHGLSWGTYSGSAQDWSRQEAYYQSFLGFRWGSDGTYNYYPIVPHWFVALLLGVLAAVPWVRWRFSVRTLLIAATLVAMVLGLIGRSMR